MTHQPTKNPPAHRSPGGGLLGLGLLLLAAAALLPLASCSERQSVRLAPDGSGSAEVQVTLSPMLIAYLHDLMAAMGDGGSGEGSASSTAASARPIFDLARISAAFAELPGVSDVVARSPSEGTLSLGFSFQSLPALFETPQLAGVQNPVSLVSSNGVTTLHFFLDRANLRAVTDLPPLRDNPLLLALVPKGDREVTQAQELELLDYAFGDYATKSLSVSDVVRSSEVRATLTVAGQILAQRGGTQSGSTVTFTVPLLRLLTMERPIDYAVSFRSKG